MSTLQECLVSGKKEGVTGAVGKITWKSTYSKEKAYPLHSRVRLDPPQLLPQVEQGRGRDVSSACQRTVKCILCAADVRNISAKSIHKQLHSALHMH